MHPLEKKTLNIIRQEKLLQREDKVIAAVSGGSDSMALLHILSRLAPVLGFSLAAAYVNHGLRPAESGEEEKLVKTEADRLGIPFFSGTVQVREFAAKNHCSIEHGARVLRYDFLNKAATSWCARKIALAHTADDQAEEVLLRLIRGTGRKGLSGMKTLRAKKFIRPLLRFPKAELLDYLEIYGLTFTIDSSNRENIYLRNRIRNELLPYLAENFNPGIRQTLIRTANILQDEEELLEHLVELAFRKTVSIDGPRTAKVDKESNSPASVPARLTIQGDIFLEQPAAIRRRLLERSCWLMGCTPSARQIENIHRLISHHSPGNCLHLADGLRVDKKGSQVIFLYPKGCGPFRGTLESGSDFRFPEIRISGPGCYELPELEKKLTVEYLDNFDPEKTLITGPGQYLNADLLSFPLILRSAETGDRFRPLGAPGSKKLSRFLNDRKINKNERNRIPVLAASESIVALPGLRIDHHYRIRQNTSRVIRICWTDKEEAG